MVLLEPLEHLSKPWYNMGIRPAGDITMPAQNAKELWDSPEMTDLARKLSDMEGAFKANRPYKGGKGKPRPKPRRAERELGTDVPSEG